MSNAVREKLEAYFASLNPTSNRMMQDIISSREEYSDRWESMHPEEQSGVLWNSIVKPDAIIKYKNLPSNSLDVEYFPVLHTRPGEKIIVEEDSASAKSFVSGTAYNDEHSAPFRWETQSQIDFRIHDLDTESEFIRTLERDVSKSPKPEDDASESPKNVQDLLKSPEPVQDVLKSPKLERDVLKSPKPERDVLKSPKPERAALKVLKPDRNTLKCLASNRDVLKSPKPDRHTLKSPISNKDVLKSPKANRNTLKSPISDKDILKSPKPDRHTLKSPTSDNDILKSPKPDRNTLKSPKLDRQTMKSSNPEIDVLKSPKLERDVLKSPRPDRHTLKKEDDVKRSTIKRPEVPPPPVPPHFIPPIPPHIETTLPPVPTHTVKAEKGDMPIYAKVVKRKSANAKTLVMSEMKAHRRAKEEMKPAVPPRMSLELKGDMSLMKYSVQDIDIDGIPKTGFDFLDNW